jgi:plasmid replication initiation protein
MAKTNSLVQIRQHNAITTARYDYTACQLDILFYLLSKLKKDDGTHQEYKIHIADMEAVTQRKWNYQQLREATADMGSRIFEVDSSKSYKQLWMFQKVEYIKGQGYMVIRLSEDMRPYLFELKDNFTSYQLHSALKLSSKYAKRIYQLASQWKDIGETKTYNLDDFKVMLKLKDPAGNEPEQFERISDFKKFVLDIAVRQINEHTDLKISYELIKQGRAFQSVRFYVNTQSLPLKQLPIPFEESQGEVKTDRARRILAEYDIKDSKLIERVLSDGNLIDQVFKLSYMLKSGKITGVKNPGGYLLKTLGLV